MFKIMIFIETNPLEYVLIVPKTIASILFLLVALKIYSLNKKYALNRIFFITFLSFSLYLLLDIFVYLFAPYSQTMFDIANIIFKIQMLILAFYMYMLFLASLVIKQGTKILKNKWVWLIGVIVLILGILICTFKIIVVLDENNNILTGLPPEVPGFKATNGTKEGYNSILALLISGFPFLLVIYTIVLFIQLRNKLKIDDPSRKRMLYFIIGIILIPFGLLYFIIQGSVAFNSYPAIIVGYVIWIISPFFLWESQIGKVPKDIIQEN